MPAAPEISRRGPLPFLANPLIVALDLDSPAECVSLAERLAGVAGAFKLGPRSLLRRGEALIREVAAFAPVFVDNKYLDIPSTMEAAVRATFESGASLATVHAWSGREALSRLAKLEARLCERRPFRILAVTILTSFEQAGLAPPMDREPVDRQTEWLARLALDSGLTGLVRSPHELKGLRALAGAASAGCFMVTPGVRLAAGPPGDDQKRVMGPAAAMALGASAIVVGRPIVEAADPVAAAQAFQAAISSGASGAPP